MPKCKVCAHPQRTEIEKLYVGQNSESLRTLAKRFEVSDSAIFRHCKKHLPLALVKSSNIKALRQTRSVMQEIDKGAAIEKLNADIVFAELGKCIERISLLCDACDDYLRDPVDPDKYDIGPRSADVTVIYTERVGQDGKVVRRKRKLSEILADLEENPDIRVISADIKHADIRELIIKGIGESRASLAFLVDLQILDHNMRQSEFFAERLFSFLDEHEPGLARKFLERVRDEKMIRQAVSLPDRTGRQHENNS